MPPPPPPATYRRRRAVVALGALALLLVVALAVRSAGSPERSIDGRAVGEAGGALGRSDEAVSTSAPTTAAATTTTTPTGRFVVAPGSSAPVGSGAGGTYRYRVEVEEGTGVDVAAFAAHVDRILADRRGWTTADGVRLQRVADASAEIAVRLATPRTTDALCFPLDTAGEVSCGTAGAAVINLTRWLEGAAPSGLGLHDYRSYVVTHEVGHLLGHEHEACAGPGQRATTMMQQTYSIGECTPNPWPAPDA
ncbi:MAG TPA: DUF3152 domain-containing protein [Aquihabitans sp.]|nr:DUF3152 domain-containing protein [Aquihabitans sp.]